MRILLVCRELPPIGGGAGYVTINLATRLARRGHDVDVVSMAHGDLPMREVVDGVTIHRVEVGRRDADSSRTPEMLRFVPAGRRRIRSLVRDAGPYDVAHAHAIIPDGWLLSALDDSTATVVTAHGSEVPGYNPDRFRRLHRVLGPVWRRAAARPDVVTAPSRHLTELVATGGVTRPVEVVPNGIDVDLFGSSARTRDVLVVTRLVPRKNVHLLLEALEQLDTPVRLHVVGDGPERTRLEGAAADLDRHRVVFHGWLAHGSPAWRDLYEHSRFFVFPSSSENFPINLLEAQLAGLVVIASDIPGNREVLGDRARYLPSLDASAIANTLRAALNTPEAHLDDEGTAARRRVIDQFGWATITDRFEQLYGAPRRQEAS